MPISLSLQWLLVEQELLSRKIDTNLFLELENPTQEPLESILTVMEARPRRHILPKLHIRYKSCQKP
jgi:hypothetical protein